MKERRKFGELCVCIPKLSLMKMERRHFVLLSPYD